MKKKIEIERPDTFSSDNIFVDAWTSGNPGQCGYKLSYLGLVQMRKYSGIHTNNYAELVAISNGLIYCYNVASLTEITNLKFTVWTDSTTALTWLKKGCANTNRDTEMLNSIINDIKAILINNPLISIKKWRTDLWGENPADSNRK